MVRADHRGAGVGRALMAAAEDWARERGAAYVALATRRAADFYPALDFEESATYFKKPPLTRGVAVELSRRWSRRRPDRRAPR